MKGTLNTSDLIRIQNNIQLLSDVLELNLTVSDVPEIPTVTLFGEIRENTGKSEVLTVFIPLHQQSRKNR